MERSHWYAERGIMQLVILTLFLFLWFTIWPQSPYASYLSL
jgi:hypothetical protein